MFKLVDNYNLDKRIYNLKKGDVQYKNDIEKFLQRFVELYHHYTYVLDRKPMTRLNLRIENYRIKVYQEYHHFNYILKIFHNRKKIVKIMSPWGSDFYQPKILDFKNESVFVLQDFHNLFVDLIQEKLIEREGNKQKLDIQALSLKELL